VAEFVIYETRPLNMPLDIGPIINPGYPKITVGNNFNRNEYKIKVIDLKPFLEEPLKNSDHLSSFF